MRLIMIHEGRLEIRWTWLPFWMAANPKLKSDVERRLRDAMLVNGVTEDDLDALHRYAIKLITRTFGFEGLGEYLDGIRHIREC